MSTNRYFFIEVEDNVVNGVSRAYADGEKRDADALASHRSGDTERSTVILIDAFVGMDGSAGITVESVEQIV